MVATILRRYSSSDAQALVERSFGSYLGSPEAQKQRDKAAAAAPESTSSSSTSSGSSSGGGGGSSGGNTVGQEMAARKRSAQPAPEKLSEQEALAWQVSALAAKLEAMASVLQGFDLSEVTAKRHEALFRTLA
jgi:hypothetical protein